MDLENVNFMNYLAKELALVDLTEEYEKLIESNFNSGISVKITIKNLKIKDKKIEDFLYNRFKDYIVK
tara:strand:- start:59 stop:262 length:204 start_codon:yes stop_codon:yes gene_type:complete